MNDRPVRITATVHNTIDGCSWYRCAGPFSRMMTKYPVQVNFTSNLGWNDVTGSDILYMTKPAEPAAIALCRLAKAFGKPVWLDYDDAVSAVPPYNPAWQPDAAGMAATLGELASMAQLVSVSTPALESLYRDLALNVELLPNAVDLNFYSTFKIHRIPNDKRVIFWRGSASQTYNMKMILQVIRKSLDKYPDIHWIMHCPMRPFSLSAAHSERVTWLGWKDIPECFLTPMEYCPDICISALFDTCFDRCRSHNAALEGIMAGAVPVVPDWWKIPGSFAYTPGDLGKKPLSDYSDKELEYASGNLFQTLEKAIKASKDTLIARHKTAFEFTVRKHSLDVVNERRWKLIQALLKVKPHQVSICQKSIG